MYQQPLVLMLGGGPLTLHARSSEATTGSAVEGIYVGAVETNDVMEQPIKEDIALFAALKLDDTSAPEPGEAVSRGRGMVLIQQIRSGRSRPM